jgi:hypothetical protein
MIHSFNMPSDELVSARVTAFGAFGWAEGSDDVSTQFRHAVSQAYVARRRARIENVDATHGYAARRVHRL